MAGKSLLDDSMLQIGSAGKTKSKPSGSGSGAASAILSNPRALIAGGIIVVAVGWLGYYYGLRPSMERSRIRAMSPPLTEEQQVEVKKQKDAAEKRAQDPTVTTGGA